MNGKDVVALIVLLIISVSIYRRVSKLLYGSASGDAAQTVRVLAPPDTIESFAALSTADIAVDVEPFGWPQLSLEQYLEMCSSTDDADTLRLLAVVDAVVLAERLEALQSFEENEFASTVVQLISTLTFKGFDTSQILLLPGVPPRHWQTDDIDTIIRYLSNVEQIVIKQLKLKQFTFLPTYCAFHQAIRENNETSYLYMPADDNNVQSTANPRGVYLIAALIHQRLFGGDVSRITPMNAPGGLSADEAVWLQRIARDCEMQLHLKQSEEL